MNYLFTRINSIFFLIYNYFTLFTMFSYHFFFYRVTFALANAVPQTSGLVSPVSLLVWDRLKAYPTLGLLLGLLLPKRESQNLASRTFFLGVPTLVN